MQQALHPPRSHPVSDLSSKIIQYEQGELEECDVIDLFQELIDTGLAWSLQGHYGRTASRMIDAGMCQGA